MDIHDHLNAALATMKHPATNYHGQLAAFVPWAAATASFTGWPRAFPRTIRSLDGSSEIGDWHSDVVYLSRRNRLLSLTTSGLLVGISCRPISILSFVRIAFLVNNFGSFWMWQKFLVNWRHCLSIVVVSILFESEVGAWLQTKIPSFDILLVVERSVHWSILGSDFQLLGISWGVGSIACHWSIFGLVFVPIICAELFLRLHNFLLYSHIWLMSHCRWRALHIMFSKRV